jgi:hypothetical protein
MSAGFRLSDRARAAIKPLLPANRPGARPADDRRVTGIIHGLRIGCRRGGGRPPARSGMALA